ncbi:MAG: hypothetical protein LBI61_04070 [Puniceicoccales bacterium]|nr:hypothetical protein [Puniceicoccales bacterium]
MRTVGGAFFTINSILADVKPYVSVEGGGDFFDGRGTWDRKVIGQVFQITYRDSVNFKNRLPSRKVAAGLSFGEGGQFKVRTEVEFGICKSWKCDVSVDD